MGWLFALGVILVSLLWFATRLRRRAIRTYLLASGAQTTAVASLYRRGRRAPRIAVRYRDNSGAEHFAVKSMVSAGDAELLKKPAAVLYHPQRPGRSDYVLVGFGKQPRRWFAVEFAPLPAAGAGSD
jgi:hypothetical protein